MNRTPVIVGAILVLAGLLGLAVPIFTTQQTTEVARIGDLKLQATENHSYVVPPLVSGGAVVLGIIVLGAGMYRRS
jgi:hypothetical protein